MTKARTLASFDSTGVLTSTSTLNPAKLDNTGTIPSALLPNVDIGNYSVHAIANYGETSTYDFTTSAHPVLITDESCTLTPTSASDIFVASGSVMTYANNVSCGSGIMLLKDTVNNFANSSNSSNWLYQSGRYADHAQSNNFYNHQSFNFHFSLANTDPHFFRLYGMVQCGSGQVTFNNDAYATTENARHNLTIVQYKYNGN